MTVDVDMKNCCGKSVIFCDLLKIFMPVNFSVIGFKKDKPPRIGEYE
jgi:hypothetical protein